MNKHLLMVLFVFLPLLANADAVEIDRLWYYLNTEAQTAELTFDQTQYYYSIEDVHIPERVSYNNVEYRVTSIGHNAFGWSETKSVTIPNSVTSIGEEAFVSSHNLTTINIPASVTSIGYNAFNGCDGLTYLYIADLSAWCNISFDGYETSNPIAWAQHVYFNGEEIKELVIPNNVTSIGKSAFIYHPTLTSVTIGNHVTSIGESAFDGCRSLTTAIIGSNVTFIGYGAFQECIKLSDVYCFAEVVPTTPESAAFGWDSSVIEHATLHVPAAAVDAYMAKEPWKNFKSIVAMHDEQCATPTITFANGELQFTCETEGVEFVPTVTCTPNQLQNGNKLLLGGTFTVSVYAVKEGFDNSDTATMTINMSQMGDVNADGELNAADITSVVNAILGK